MTSKLAFEEWRQAFAKSKLLCAAMVDRMLHGAYQIILDCDSYCKLREQMDKQKRVEKELVKLPENSPTKMGIIEMPKSLN